MDGLDASTRQRWGKTRLPRVSIDPQRFSPEGQMNELSESALYAVAFRAKALLDDIRHRHPGEKLRCPLLIALDAALIDADSVGAFAHSEAASQA